MFTGIVREAARVAEFAQGRLVVETSLPAAVGDSVALDGVCLTVADMRDGTLVFDVVPETLARAKPFGERVNVEPALRAGEPLGGHFVQGHVDAIGLVRAFEAVGTDVRLTIEASGEVLRYCVEKGSISVDGVSLTIAALDDDTFTVALVPHTLATTTLGALEARSQVNLEVDVLAKYVEKSVQGREH
jgi:riboflavin synthase alpha subunit